MNVTHAALSAIFMNLKTTFNNTFGAEARAAAGFGHWQLAYGSTGTVA